MPKTSSLNYADASPVKLEKKLLEQLKLRLPLSFPEDKMSFVNVVCPKKNWGLEISGTVEGEEVYTNDEYGTTSFRVKFTSTLLKKTLDQWSTQLAKKCKLIVKEVMDDYGVCFLKLKESVVVNGEPVDMERFESLLHEGGEFTALIEPGFYVNTSTDQAGTYFKLKKIDFK